MKLVIKEDKRALCVLSILKTFSNENKHKLYDHSIS